MELKDLMGVIRIIKTPDGEMPIEVRDKWVGVEIPCLCRSDNDESEVGLQSGQLKSGFRDVYVVKQKDAVAALAKKCPAAAEFWKKRGFPRNDDSFFSFGVDEAEEVKPVVSRDDFLLFGGDFCASDAAISN